MRLFKRKPSRDERLEQLLQAIEAPDLMRVSALLDRDRDLLAARNAYGVFPLMYAIFRHQPAAAELLLQQGADPNAQSRDGGSMLTLATVEGQPATVDALLAHGANPNYPDRFGATALMYASQLDEPEVARRLIGAGADVQARDAEGDTVLMYAVNRENRALIDLLIEAGANPMARNFDNQTAFDKARSQDIIDRLQARRP